MTKYREFMTPIVKLHRCPCGEWPDKVLIQGRPPTDWMTVGGDCCGIWEIPFESQHAVGDELQKIAETAWNVAPRVIYETRKVSKNR